MNKIRIPVRMIAAVMKDLVVDPEKKEWSFISAGGNRLIVTRKKEKDFDSLDFEYDD